MTWITKFVEELKNDKWVLPALKQIREICQLFPEVRTINFNAYIFHAIASSLI